VVVFWRLGLGVGHQQSGVWGGGGGWQGGGLAGVVWVWVWWVGRIVEFIERKQKTIRIIKIHIE